MHDLFCRPEILSYRVLVLASQLTPSGQQTPPMDTGMVGIEMFVCPSNGFPDSGGLSDPQEIPQSLTTTAFVSRCRLGNQRKPLTTFLLTTSGKGGRRHGPGRTAVMNS